MRTTLVVVLWLAATAGVVYVANAAVELVDLQVFPGGSRIEVLSLPEPAGPSSATTLPPTTLPPTTSSPASVTSAPVTTILSATLLPTTTIAPPSTTGAVVTTSSTTTTSAAPPTTVPPATLAPPTTVAPPSTTAAVVTTSSTTTTPAATVPPTTTQAPTVTTTQPPAPTTTVPPVLPLVVSTASLPEARIGDSYRVDLEAVGGTPPYSWSLSAGALPAGLELSTGGVLSGVPSTMVDVSLVVTAADSDGRAAASSTLVFATTPDRQTVRARGGTIFIDNEGDSVLLFLASPADGYSAVIVEAGGFRVEVQFVPLQGDVTSFVVCEVNDGVVCTSG